MLWQITLKYMAVLSLGLIAIGCSSPDSHRLIARTIAPASEAQIAGKHRIYIATTRQRSDQAGFIFSGDRNMEASYALADITIPALHKTGHIERPIAPEVADPARYITARRLGIYNSAADFKSELSDNVKKNGGNAMVFIHGYNTAFDDAVYRMAQVAHDSGYKGSIVLFTWPSAGRVVDYLYDQNSATASRDGLEDLLELVAATGVKRIDIVAHSMGSWLTMETLRQMAMTGNKSLNGKLKDIVLASPDIDADVFKSQMKRYGKPTGNFFVLTSKNDRALDVARLISGQQERVGAILNADELSEYGIIVVDITAISSDDRLNHAKFAENPLLVKLLGETLTSDNTQQSSNEIVTQFKSLSSSLGQTVGTAANIIITTPLRVIDLAVQ